VTLVTRTMNSVLTMLKKLSAHNGCFRGRYSPYLAAKRRAFANHKQPFRIAVTVWFMSAGCCLNVCANWLIYHQYLDDLGRCLITFTEDELNVLGKLLKGCFGRDKSTAKTLKITIFLTGIIKSKKTFIIHITCWNIYINYCIWTLFKYSSEKIPKRCVLGKNSKKKWLNNAPLIKKWAGYKKDLAVCPKLQPRIYRTFSYG